MFVQIGWGRNNAGAWEGLKALYLDKIIPVTMTMPGLIERQLWRGVTDQDESLFWSVWDTLVHLRLYETSDERRALAQEAEKFFHPFAYSWGDAWIKHFEIIWDSENCIEDLVASQSDKEDPMHVMIAWGKLRLGGWDQYEKFYRERVQPTTKSVTGLRERQLLRSTEDPDEGISLSIWETQEDLVNYERSEVRQNLANDVKDLYRGEFWVKHFEVSDASTNETPRPPEEPVAVADTSI